MRRPLDWIVVSISVMTIFANRMWAQKPDEPPASPPRVATTGNGAGNPADTLFAYIREDGSLQFLPAAPAIEARQPADTRSVSLSTALYTWSSPSLLVERDLPDFQ